MARTPKETSPNPANLSHAQLREAIPRIQRRIDELKSFDVNSVVDNDPRIGVLSNKLDALLLSIFGANTIEYNRYKWPVTNIDATSYRFMDDTPLYEIHEGIRRGLSTCIHQLESLVSEFTEELNSDNDSPVSRSLRAYAGLDIHPAIERAAGKLYRDGHYANAVEDSVKALNALVRLNSGLDDKDGTQLMEAAFNPKNPVLQFNDLADDSDHNEQRGFMMMFSGAVAGLRNPRAHKIIKDDPAMALEFIAFVSLLAQLADKARRV